MVELRQKTNTLSITEALQLARAAGFPGDQAVTAVAVAMAESNLNPRAKNDNAGTGDYSIGLWQINMRAHKTRFGTEEQLKNPAVNARAAHTIWRERNGGSWAPWGAYTNGSYRDHLPAIKSALGAKVGTTTVLGIRQASGGSWWDEVGETLEGIWNWGSPEQIGGAVTEAAGDLFDIDGLMRQVLSVGLGLVFTTAALALIALGLFRLTGTDAGTIFKAGSTAAGAGGALKAVT